MDARNKAQQIIYKMIDPVVRGLVKMGVTPNFVTGTGLFLNIIACSILIYGSIHGERGDFSSVGWAGAVILFAGLFDMLDGQVARIGKKSSRYGALFDSVMDRYSELIVLFGICYYLIMHFYFLSSLFGFIALIGSMMVSYVRARAEGLGIECKGGFMQRPERVVTISLASIGCGIFDQLLVLVIPLAVVALLSNITAIGRLNHCRKVLTEEDER
ncbi:MAG: CDP-alcohol phosphatidyltransferase family protein [Dysgonamonadaceae bacterium]|nr:CDP-alcohol phosphatidyltransferase family protein [Dysgonamonadaceae bacterium]